MAAAGCLPPFWSARVADLAAATFHPDTLEVRMSIGPGVAAYRVAVGAAGTPTVTFYDEETPTDPTGSTATVTVTNVAGTAIATAASTTRSSAGVYAYALAKLSVPDLLTLVWTGTFSGVSQSVTTRAEVVGGRYFALGELRAAETQVQSTTDYPTARLVDARDRAEQRLEECMGRSFVSRVSVDRFTVGGGCHLRLRHPHVTSIRQVTVDGTAADSTSYTLQGGEFTPRLYRSTGWGNFTYADAVIEVAYVHGVGTVPDDVKWAAMKLAAFYAQRSGVPDRAMGRATGPDGESYTIATPGSGRVGIPEVDAIIADRRLVRFG